MNEVFSLALNFYTFRKGRGQARVFWNDYGVLLVDSVKRDTKEKTNEPIT